MADATTTTRRCIGSKRFGIEAHEAPVEDFPTQPSQRDGLGRMCRTHLNQYTAGLARDAKARKAAEDRADGEPAEPAAETADPTEVTPVETPKPERKRARRARDNGGAGD